jgi:hypothetical protein
MTVNFNDQKLSLSATELHLFLANRDVLYCNPLGLIFNIMDKLKPKLSFGFC